MLATIFIWALVAGFAGAGVLNALAPAAQQESFIRWGYPRWWCRTTGLLELATAVLIAVPASRTAGMVLAAIILSAATLTVVRYREYSHLIPIGVFLIVLAAAHATS